MNETMTYAENQAELNAAYDQALARARAHIAAGTDYSPAEWQAEVQRAIISGQPENANWRHRTPSPLSLKQVAANDALERRLALAGCTPVRRSRKVRVRR